jgi:DNA-binding NtrC family response regulator
LLDLSLPDATGFSGFLRLRKTHPRLPVAIVLSDEDQHIIREAPSLGTAGYLPKSTSKSEWALSIERVLSGSVSIPNNLVIQNEQGNVNLTEALRARLADKAHVTEILRKLKLFSCNKAVIEIGKIDLPVPKQQAPRIERGRST